MNSNSRMVHLQWCVCVKANTIQLACSKHPLDPQDELSYDCLTDCQGRAAMTLFHIDAMLNVYTIHVSPIELDRRLELNVAADVPSRTRGSAVAPRVNCTKARSPTRTCNSSPTLRYIDKNCT